MSLFVFSKNRVYKISDFYIMCLTFGIFYGITKIVKNILEKRTAEQNTNEKQTTLTLRNPRGGSTSLTDWINLGENTELAEAILSCIADNKSYIIKEPKIRDLIFGILTANVGKEALILSPNLMRFLTLKIISNYQSQGVLRQMGNFVASSDNRVRLTIRVFGSAIIGVMSAVSGGLAYGLLALLLSFDVTHDCGYPCKNYFEEIPPEGPIEIVDKKFGGQLIIQGNDDARQVEIFTRTEQKAAKEPIAVKEQTTPVRKDKLQRTYTYTRSRKKAKQVNFTDFRKSDPVLSSFGDREEPYVPQQKCELQKIENIDFIE